MTDDEPGDDGEPAVGEQESGESVDGQADNSAGDDDGSVENGGSAENGESTDDDGNWVSDSVDEGSEEPTEFDADSGGSAGQGGSPESQTGGNGNGQPTGGGQPGGAPANSGGATGGEKGPNEKYCTECGAIINAKAEICPECGVRQPSAGSGDDERLIAALLAIFLGGIGAHKFYMGKTGQGLLYLCFFWTAIPALIGIIEGVIYLSKSDEEFRQQYMQD